MNTPTLLSLLSSPVGKTDTARTGSAAGPAHGVDFSQLLGERRSQQAVVRDSNSGRSDHAARSVDRSGVSERQAPTRNESGAASQADTRNNDRNTSASRSENQPANKTESGRTTSATRDGQSSTNNAGEPAPESGTGSSNSADSSQPVAVEDASTGASDNEATAAVVTPTNPADAALAQNAAEAGLAVFAAETMANADVETDVAINMGAPRGATAGADTALPLQRPVPSALHQVDPATAAAVAELELDADVKPVAGPTIQTTVAANAGSATRAAANGFTLTAAAVPLGAVSPAPQGEPPIAAPTLPTATPAALYQAAPDQPLNNIAMQLSTDAPGSAAALSLQDFTAMVAAARATSGTSLQPTAATSVTAPPVTMPGLMPTGFFPAQGLAPMAAAGINAPLSSPQWATEFGRQFISIAQSGNGLGQVAELRLDPPDLGPLRITINLNDNVAHAVFSSPHAAVRQTVENAIPQLQQMLEQAGISLGQANVNDQNQAGQAFQEQNGQGRRSANAGSDGGVSGAGHDGASTARARPADPSALVDTFA